MHNKYLHKMCVHWFDDLLTNKYWFYKLYLETATLEKYKIIFFERNNVNQKKHQLYRYMAIWVCFTSKFYDIKFCWENPNVKMHIQVFSWPNSVDGVYNPYLNEFTCY